MRELGIVLLATAAGLSAAAAEDARSHAPPNATLAGSFAPAGYRDVYRAAPPACPVNYYYACRDHDPYWGYRRHCACWPYWPFWQH